MMTKAYSAEKCDEKCVECGEYDNYAGEILHLGEEDGKWEKMPIILDSGAVETVGPKTAASNVKMRESEMSKEGKGYKVANGTQIPNMGEKQIQWVDDRGMIGQMTMQVTDVTKVLASVSKVCDAGNTVTFGARGGEIRNEKTGKVTPLVRKGGVYVLDVWVKAKNEGDMIAPVFHWQERKW